MTLRNFLKLFPVGALAATVPPVLPKRPEIPWMVLVCDGGTTVFDNIEKARAMAALYKVEVRFTFNYHRHFCVFPNGTVQHVDDALWSDKPNDH